MKLDLTKLYADLGYMVLYGVGEYHVEFKVFEVLSLTPVLLLHSRHYDSRPNPVDTFEDAEVFLAGSIKLDGCADLTWSPDGDGYHHYCSRKQATEVGTLLYRLYDLAAASMPNMDEGKKPDILLAGGNK